VVYPLTTKVSASSYSLKDIKNNESFSMSSLTVAVDTTKNTASISASNIQYSLTDYSISTARYAKILSATDWESLPEITVQQNNFESIKGNVPGFAAIFISGDNTIAIKSPLGISIDAGAGNDKVTGGTGNDTITAGAGGDSLTGGKGNDTFILKKSDYDFTSAKTVLADTIADFKYTASEKDTLTLDGFGDVDAYKSLALAKKRARLPT
jgi:Ca2+-binding RTX toxin-like protein